MQIHIGKQMIFPEGERQILCDQHVVAAALMDGEGKAETFGRVLRLFERAFQTFNHFELAFRRADVFLAVPLALLGDNALQPGDFPLGVVVFALHGKPVFLFLRQKSRVISPVRCQTSVLHFKGALGDAVEKITVVGDDEKGPVIGAQEVLQPFHALDVQMVRRFVEQQKIRAAEQHFCQLKLGLLPAAQDGYRLGHLRVVKAKAHEGGARPRPAGQTALALKAFRQGSLPLDQLVQIARFRLKPVIDFLQFPFHLQERGKDGEHLAVGAFFQIAADMLLHVADHGGICLIDFAPVAGKISRQHTEQRCFSGAVHAHQSDVVAFLNLERRAREDNVGAEGFL